MSEQGNFPEVISDIGMRTAVNEWRLSGCDLQRKNGKIFVGKRQYPEYQYGPKHWPGYGLEWWEWVVCYNRHPLGWGKEFSLIEVPIKARP